jgi:hypothetical protein
VTTINAAELAALPLSERVAHRAGAVDWRKVFISMLMLVPFLVGAVAWFTVKSVGWVLSWIYAATVEGWHAAGVRYGDGGSP